MASTLALTNSMFGPSTIAGINCKWHLCGLVFSSQDDLIEHVLSEHVGKVAPIKRRELPPDQIVHEGDEGLDNFSDRYGYEHETHLDGP